MIIGVPKEIKLQEHRIGLTPESVKVLVERNHEVLVENNGGLEAGFTNEDYLQAGAKLISTPEEIFKTAELIVKVKEPLPEEFKFLSSDKTLFTYLHLAGNKSQAVELMNTVVTGIAYETVTSSDGS